MKKKEASMSEHEFRFFDRRFFLRSTVAAFVGLPVLSLTAFASGCDRDRRALALAPSSENEPKELSWKTVITSADEPGTPLVVSGRIFDADGKTPVVGITLHVYHTDARGLYSEEDGKGGPPKPRLKGWMQTDREGRYEFRTIRPASYPNSRNPQHIHAKVYGAGHAERWIPEYWFDDDPLVTDEMRAKHAGQGTFTPIMSAKRGDDGVLHCVRDIKL
jgi:protocatechuate 3,4-dioxygenase beta subunit